MRIKPSIYTTSLSAFINLMWAYLVYFLCRLTYGLENWNVLGENLTSKGIWDVLKGGWIFDTAAIMYTNSLYMLLMIFPFHWKERKGWQKITKFIFLLINTLAICMNLADAIYFQYTGRRTTATIFSEFSNEGNLGSVFIAEFINHWYLVLLAILLVIVLI